MNARKLAPLTGIGAVILFVVSFLLSGETPDVDATALEVRDFYEGEEGKQMGASLALALGGVLFLLFAGALRSALVRADRGRGSLPALALSGAVAVAIGTGIFASINFALADIADEEVEPAVLQTLNVMNADLFFPAAIGLSVFYLATGLAVVREGGLPTWLGWAAIVLGVIAITPAGFVAFLALGIWVLIASVLLYMRAEEA
jgi:hypothetical protein